MTKDQLEKIIETLQAAVEDAAKFDSGNSAAGTRVRKAAQMGKTALQDLRLDIQGKKNA